MHIIGKPLTWSREIIKDKAVLYGFSNNIWSIISGLVTTPLIILFFTPTLQGFYYLFKSILQIQNLFVLGIGTILQQFASHEWTHLQWERKKGITGDPVAASRLRSLAHFTLRWYLAVALLMCISVGIVGYLFLRYGQTDQILQQSVWLWPWIAICIATAVQLMIAPARVLLTGCNFVKEVKKINLFQNMSSCSAIWITMALGAQLWVFFSGAVAWILTGFLIYWHKFSDFFSSLTRLKGSDEIQWRTEILPFQWRYAVSWIAGYVNYSLLIPILFSTRDAVSAGQLGMTFSLFMIVLRFASVIINTKLPSWAMDFASGETTKMNRNFRRIVLQSAGFTMLGSLFVLTVIWSLHVFDVTFANRFLPILPVAFLAAAMIPENLKFSMTNYVWAQKKEPFWTLHIGEAVLGITLLPVLGYFQGASGLCAGFLLISVITAYFSFRIFRRHIC